MFPFEDFLNHFGNILTTILSIGTSTFFLGKYCIVKPIRKIIQDENITTNTRLVAIEDENKEINTRLISIEAELKTNNGSSLRDAVDRMEREMKDAKKEMSDLKAKVIKMEKKG